jgi:hypothetical protein
MVLNLDYLTSRKKGFCFQGWLSLSSEESGRGAASTDYTCKRNECLFFSVSHESLSSRRDIIHEMRHEVLPIL